MRHSVRWIVLSAAGWTVLAALAGPASPATPPPTAKPVGEPDITFAGQDEDAGDSAPTNPFAAGEQAVYRKDAVPGCVELSDGTKRAGSIYTTRAKRLKIFNLKRKIYEFVPVPACKRIEDVVEWERLERQWRFKEAGNLEKVYTGRAYPVRMHAWRLTLRNDHEIVGHILGQPLYAFHDGKAERFILHKRHKGPLGAQLEDLVHIRRVVLGPQAYNEALEALKAPGAKAPGQDGKQAPGASQEGPRGPDSE